MDACKIDRVEASRILGNTNRTQDNDDGEERKDGWIKDRGRKSEKRNRKSENAASCRFRDTQESVWESVLFVVDFLFNDNV